MLNDVGVVVPIFVNSEAQVHRALASILPPDEPRPHLVIVLDGTADTMGPVVDRVLATLPAPASLTVSSHPHNRGIAASLALGYAYLDMRAVPFATWMGADDAFLPGALEVLAQAMREPGAELVVGLPYRVTPSGEPIPDQDFHLVLAAIDEEAEDGWAHPNLPLRLRLLAGAMFRTSAAMLSPPRPAFELAEDFDFYLRLVVNAGGRGLRLLRQPLYAFTVGGPGAYTTDRRRDILASVSRAFLAVVVPNLAVFGNPPIRTILWEDPARRERLDDVVPLAEGGCDLVVLLAPANLPYEEIHDTGVFFDCVVTP